MLFCEERLLEPLLTPDWDGLIPVITRARTMAVEGTLARGDVDDVITRLAPFIPEIHSYMLREYRSELVKLIAKSKKERAKQAHRERVAACANGLCCGSAWATVKKSRRMALIAG